MHQFLFLSCVLSVFGQLHKKRFVDKSALTHFVWLFSIVFHIPSAAEFTADAGGKEINRPLSESTDPSSASCLWRLLPQLGRLIRVSGKRADIKNPIFHYETECGSFTPRKYTKPKHLKESKSTCWRTFLLSPWIYSSASRTLHLPHPQIHVPGGRGRLALAHIWKGQQPAAGPGAAPLALVILPGTEQVDFCILDKTTIHNNECLWQLGTDQCFDLNYEKLWELLGILACVVVDVVVPGCDCWSRCHQSTGVQESHRRPEIPPKKHCLLEIHSWPFVTIYNTLKYLIYRS